MTMKLIFQMVCILCPECNFLHGSFRCQLPVEMVDVEVKVKTMQGIHTFQRDRTSQVIKCNPWSTRLHLYPSLIQKMKTYLELEGKLGPKPRPHPQTPAHNKPRCNLPNQAPTPWLEMPQGPKANVPDKRKRTMIAKRRYKVRVVIQPTPSIPISTTPAPMVATVSTQTPSIKSTAESILMTVYKLTMGKFAEVPCPTTRPQNKISNPLPLEDITNAPPRQSTSWPNTGSASEHLFETTKDWPIPPIPVPTPGPPSKQKSDPKLQQSPMP